MKVKTIFGIIFIVASLIKLASLLHLIHISWLERVSDRGDSKLTTWVYRITMNTCITYLRQSYTEPLTIPLTTDIAERFADQEEKAEQLRELYLLISQLGKLERALILLWLDERSYQEMADILGISKASIAVKLHRVKEKLKKMSNS